MVIDIQTFLPELTFDDSVKVLDSKRLNAQLGEGRQILDAIAKTPEGGRQRNTDGKLTFAANHPVTNMWRGSEGRLVQYLASVVVECENRGISSTKNWAHILDLSNNNLWSSLASDLPWWWLDYDERIRVLNSHRANLFSKDPIHYHEYAGTAKVFFEALADTPHDVVCCPEKVAKGKHKPYYYPTHMEA